MRKTRKTLIDSSPTSKYALYATGEILLVMIGILLALQVNNWSESNKLKVAEREFIKGVKTDLTEDRKSIDLVINQGQEMVKIYNLLDKELSNTQIHSGILLDSLLRSNLRTYLTSNSTFYPITGYYQSAISSDLFSKFKDEKFKSSIIKLYNSTYDRLITNGNLSDSRWDYLTKKYTHDRRTNFTEINSAQYSELLDDLFYHYKQMIYYESRLIEARDGIDEILSEVE